MAIFFDAVDVAIYIVFIFTTTHTHKHIHFIGLTSYLIAVESSYSATYRSYWITIRPHIWMNYGKHSFYRNHAAIQYRYMYTFFYYANGFKSWSPEKYRLLETALWFLFFVQTVENKVSFWPLLLLHIFRFVFISLTTADRSFQCWQKRGTEKKREKATEWYEEKKTQPASTKKKLLYLS